MPLVIRGQRGAPDPESRYEFVSFWIAGSLALLAPRNDREKFMKRGLPTPSLYH
jgi:hypothetical protein